MDVKASSPAAATSAGRALHEFAARLYPICRSITGAGVRETLALIRARVPLIVHEVPSGTRVFDWEIPLEWNVEDAAVIDAHGRRGVGFQAHNLHLVGYSEPVQTSVSPPELSARPPVLPGHPDWIPYPPTSFWRA